MRREGWAMDDPMSVPGLFLMLIFVLVALLGATRVMR
jgi:hypothetical protein